MKKEMNKSKLDVKDMEKKGYKKIMDKDKKEDKEMLKKEVKKSALKKK